MRQRVYVLTTTLSAITGIALILSLLSLGVDLGYHGRIPGSAPAPDGPLVVPAAAVDRRALATGGSSGEGRLTAAVLDVAAPAPRRAPAPDPDPAASPRPRDRERPVQERARRLRRPGGAVPSVPAPAPVPAPAAPQPVAVPAANNGSGGDDEDDERRGREDGEGGGAAPARSGPEQNRERAGRVLRRALGRGSDARPPCTHNVVHARHDQGAGRVDVDHGRQSAPPPLKRHPRWKDEGERSRGHGGGRPAEPRGKPGRGRP